MRVADYPNYYFLLYIAPFGGIMLISTIAKYIRSKILTELGENSLPIMCIHMMILGFLLRIIEYLTKIDKETLRSDFFAVTLTTIFTVIISLLLSKNIKKYLPFMVGSKKR